ncbi:HAD family hydrolase [Phascolarctobacterium succinatutens]|uniref:HAD family hydrolase n=1 Tax=Phascolarctobacterium succinatutens TaxID=626940 RepID=UPI0026F27EC7|nr:HAD-IIIA family hydrolase [Phascolarctobacterium succinatutens]
MKYTTIIFDLDGTLLNTLADLAAATNHALAEHKLPQRTTDEVRRFVGNGIRKLIERAVPADTPAELQEEVFASFNRYYKRHCADSTRPYEGVPQLLQQLRTAGCRTAIVSNKADYGVQALAKQYFDGRLDAACGESAGIAKKPAPDMLLAIMRQLKAEPASTIYIGDSDTDLDTARNAGVACIGACWGFRGRAFLEAHGAKLLAENVGDIWELIK